MKRNIFGKGSEIDIIAPAGGGIGKEAIKGMQNKFESLGYTLNIPNDLINDTAFCSNTDEYRLNHLVASLNSSKSKIVWAIRGGYGCARLIMGLDKITISGEEKILIGFSDITALHLYLSRRWGVKTIHGSVAAQINAQDKDPENFNILFNLLTQEDYEVNIPIEKQLNSIKFEDLNGKLSGGNLAIVQTSIGTLWQIDCKDKIIFLEDINEEGYKVDRMLEHLMQAGVFERAKAVVFGEFLEKEGENTDIENALKRFAGRVGFPVFKTKYFGHGYHNYPIVYNAQASVIRTSTEIVLKYDIKNSKE